VTGVAALTRAFAAEKTRPRVATMLPDHGLTVSARDADEDKPQ